MRQKEIRSNRKITKIGITNDTLTSRGGLVLFTVYWPHVGSQIKLTGGLSDLSHSPPFVKGVGGFNQ